MSTTLPTDLSLSELRDIIAAARAAGWSPRDKPQPHIVSPVSGACTRCGHGSAATARNPYCEELPNGGAYTGERDARERTMGKPLPPLPARTGARPFPVPRGRLLLTGPGRVGTGRDCEHGCDVYAAHVDCEWHA